MKIYESQPNQTILKEVGTRIKQRRISLVITQQELSEKTGISLRTINNIERGLNFSLDNLLSVLRILKLIDGVDQLIPESRTDPIALLKMAKPRKRVSRNKQTTDWKWGDEK